MSETAELQLTQVVVSIGTILISECICTGLCALLGCTSRLQKKLLLVLNTLMDVTFLATTVKRLRNPSITVVHDRLVVVSCRDTCSTTNEQKVT